MHLIYINIKSHNSLTPPSPPSTSFSSSPSSSFSSSSSPMKVATFSRETNDSQLVEANPIPPELALAFLNSYVVIDLLVFIVSYRIRSVSLLRLETDLSSCTCQTHSYPSHSRCMDQHRSQEASLRSQHHLA